MPFFEQGVFLSVAKGGGIVAVAEGIQLARGIDPRNAPIERPFRYAL
jgi:hypothetical protein